MDDPADQFKRHALESRELARRAENEHERALYEEIAFHWDALAELWPRISGSKRERS